jgi:hypothetical protein
MVQVKIFSSADIDHTLEYQINDWLSKNRSINVRDIKFTSTKYDSTALVIYEAYNVQN